MDFTSKYGPKLIHHEIPSDPGGRSFGYGLGTTHPTLEAESKTVGSKGMMEWEFVESKKLLELSWRNWKELSFHLQTAAMIWAVCIRNIAICRVQISKVVKMSCQTSLAGRPKKDRVSILALRISPGEDVGRLLSLYPKPRVEKPGGSDSVELELTTFSC